MQKLASQMVLPLVLATLGLGAIQSILKVTFPSIGIATLLDDATLMLAGIAMLAGRFSRVGWWSWGVLFCWAALTLVAFVRAPMPTADALEIVRQIAVPAVMIVIGLALTRREWHLVSIIAVGIAAANSIYAVFEMVFGRLIDPAPMASDQDWMPHGVPASYFWYDSAGEQLPRAGGLVLNPPIAGIVIAGGIVLGCALARRWWQYALVLLMIVPLYLTHSRAGMVIAAIGVALPFVLRYMGYILAIAAAMLAAIPVYSYFASHGNTISHVRGFLSAFGVLRENPLGAPLGSYGNIAARSGDVVGGESLVGLMVSTLGIPGVIIILVTLSALVWSAIRGTPTLFAASLGLGIAIAAMVSESAGALNGTLPLWAAIGVAIAHNDADQRLYAFPLGRRRMTRRGERQRGVVHDTGRASAH